MTFSSIRPSFALKIQLDDIHSCQLTEIQKGYGLVASFESGLLFCAEGQLLEGGQPVNFTHHHDEVKQILTITDDVFEAMTILLVFDVISRDLLQDIRDSLQQLAFQTSSEGSSCSAACHQKQQSPPRMTPHLLLLMIGTSNLFFYVCGFWSSFGVLSKDTMVSRF